jgi:hypothetical protein
MARVFFFAVAAAAAAAGVWALRWGGERKPRQAAAAAAAAAAVKRARGGGAPLSLYCGANARGGVIDAVAGGIGWTDRIREFPTDVTEKSECVSSHLFMYATYWCLVFLCI